MNFSLRNFIRSPLKLASQQHVQRISSEVSKDNSIANDEEFRVFEIKPSRSQSAPRRRRRFLAPKGAARASRLDPDSMDWKSIWPGPRTFAPHTVPLPVRQGILKEGQVPYDKYANLELMKIPNFLHLTPPAIKAHCEELKKFCTPFPAELDSRRKCEEHFPLTVVTNDYLHSSPSVRDPLARVVTIKICLKDIPLDEHARDKLLRLVGERYNPEQDSITIVTDRCPSRKQNYDYAQYLLTALFFESWKTEPWEAEKTEKDMEKYIWQNNASSRTMATILKWTPDKFGKTFVEDPLPEADLRPEQKDFQEAVTQVMQDDSEIAMRNYKKATMRLLLRN